MQLALTLSCRLPIHHIHWHLCWHTTNLKTNAVGSYIRMWITNLPYLLVFTLVHQQCRNQCSWLLHCPLGYKSTISAGVYTGIQPMYNPMQLAPTLAHGSQTNHTCWCLHWYTIDVQPYTVGSYIRMWITKLPYSLVFTLVCEQCRCQCSWLLHLAYILQTHHTCWCLH